MRYWKMAFTHKRGLLGDIEPKMCNDHHPSSYCVSHELQLIFLLWVLNRCFILQFPYAPTLSFNITSCTSHQHFLLPSNQTSFPIKSYHWVINPNAMQNKKRSHPENSQTSANISDSKRRKQEVILWFDNYLYFYDLIIICCNLDYLCNSMIW